MMSPPRLQLALKDPLALKEYLKQQEQRRQMAFLQALTTGGSVAANAKVANLFKPAGGGGAGAGASPAAGGAPGGAPSGAPSAAAPGGAADKEEEVVDTRTEAELRKALSLPLLVPKKDRKKLARQRPWRVLHGDAEALDARQPRDISEEPRFHKVRGAPSPQIVPDRPRSPQIAPDRPGRPSLERDPLSLDRPRSPLDLHLTAHGPLRSTSMIGTHGALTLTHGPLTSRGRWARCRASRPSPTRATYPRSRRASSSSSVRSAGWWRARSV